MKYLFSFIVFSLLTGCVSFGEPKAPESVVTFYCQGSNQDLTVMTYSNNSLTLNYFGKEVYMQPTIDADGSASKNTYSNNHLLWQVNARTGTLYPVNQDSTLGNKIDTCVIK